MKNFKVIFIVLFIFTLINGTVGAQSSPPPTPGTGQSTSSPSTVSIQYNTLYAPANSDLWLINSSTGSPTYIGSIGYQGTDIAFSGTSLFGVSFSDFLSIDPTTGSGQVIGNIGYSDVNALTIALDGNVYAGTVSGAFIRIDKTTGHGALIGYYGPGLGSSGDLAFRDDGVLFAAITRSGYSTTWLAVVNLVNGTATPVGDIGFLDVWGLSFKNGELYGVTEAGDILKINTANGNSTKIGSSTSNFWGLSTSGKALTGNITSPVDNTTTGPVSTQIAADASYPGGNGVQQVEFYVLYDGTWHPAGIDTSAPYVVPWQTPLALRSQQLQFRIDVVGNDGQRTNYAGGIRRINFIQSSGGSGIAENWIPTKAYLNQRSLSPDGDSKCNVSSMSMVLAMEGFIGLDYLSMADKANEMYPHVLIDGLAYVYKMRDELRRQGAESEYKGPWSANTAWPFLKAEIDAGRPVIVGPPPGVVTAAGHFVVGVGYQESDGKRLLIAYDPFGEWRGVSGIYNINIAGDPTSNKGQWVYYDFDDFFAGNNGYLITARNPNLNSIRSVAPLTPPDPISTEPAIIGTYQGIRVMSSQVYLPVVTRNYGGRTSYNWFDATNGGTVVAQGDETYQYVGLPFAFGFYGNTYTGLYVSSNGYVTFGSGYSYYSNSCIPSASTPNNAIYAFWDDLTPSGGSNGNIYVKQIDNSTFVVEWYQVKQYGSSYYQTFEIVLRNDHSIALQYQSIGNTGSTTVGVENAMGTLAKQHICNGAGTPLVNQFAIRYTTP